MKRTIATIFTAGFCIPMVLSGCLSSKQVISGYGDQAKRNQTEGVGKPGDRAEESRKMEDLIRKMEETEQRLLEAERKNRETLRRLEEAAKKNERSLKRIEKAGEKIEAVGNKEVR